MINNTGFEEFARLNGAMKVPTEFSNLLRERQERINKIAIPELEALKKSINLPMPKEIQRAVEEIQRANEKNQTVLLPMLKELQKDSERNKKTFQNFFTRVQNLSNKTNDTRPAYNSIFPPSHQEVCRKCRNKNPKEIIATKPSNTSNKNTKVNQFILSYFLSKGLDFVFLLF